MRAFGFHQHGGPEVLTFLDLPEPTPGPHDVVLRVEAVALNHLDLWVREGWPGLRLDLPHVAGTDATGVVERVGDHVVGLDPGMPVLVNPTLWCGTCEACLRGEQSLCREFKLLGEHSRGALAERIVVPARNLARRPPALSVEEAAAAPLVFQTAWRMAQRARIRPGDTVVVPGAGGGVATAAIQVAKLLGARVIATTSSKEKAERAHRLGADDVVLYTEEGWGKRVYELTGKRGVDAVLDSVGAKVWPDAQRFLKPGGRLVCCGATSGSAATLDVRYVFFRQLEFIGSTMANSREFAEAMALVASGRLKPVVDKVFPFEKAKDAFERIEKGEQFGKVVVKL